MKTKMLKKYQNLNLWKKVILITAIIIMILVVIFITWAKMSMKAEPIALAKFLEISKDKFIIKENTNYWEISPKICNIDNCSKGIIFYPGAKVDPKAYFYKLGFLVESHRLFITKPPLNLALFNINQADGIINNNLEVTSWTIGGHSLGGAMACEYTKSHPYIISNLILIGSYCNTDISKAGVKVISIRGSQDGVLRAEKLIENFKNLPTKTFDHIISGMNHAEAGNYGDQSGDMPSTKSDDEVKKELEQIIINEL